jgi:hypothetical protein
MHAEVNLEILRRARHKQGIEVLLTEIYSRDFDTRLSGQITALEAALITTCGGNTHLLSLFNSLRSHRLQSMADRHQYNRFKQALFWFVGLSVSDDFDAVKVHYFQSQIADLLHKKERMEAEIDRTNWSITAG